MRILDRYIARSFLFCSLVVFLVFMSLRIMGDLFVNLDEFVKHERTGGEVLAQIARYYGAQSLLYIAELGGVVITFSSAFTLARMNRSNELTAVLASGVSLYRVLLPIVLCALLLGGLVVLDREVAIPQYAQQLALDRGERVEEETFKVLAMRDSGNTLWHARQFNAGDGTMQLAVALPIEQGKMVAKIVMPLAHAGTWPDGQTGWYARTGSILGESARYFWPQSPGKVYTSAGPDQLRRVDGRLQVTDADYRMVLTAQRLVRSGQQAILIEPVFAFHQAGPEGETGRAMAYVRADRAIWQEPSGARQRRQSHWETVNGRMFVPTDLTPDDIVLRQSNRWLEFTSTSQLNELLSRGRVPDRRAALLSKHLRVTEPINNLIMLLLPLPFILSRERNVKTSIGLAVLIVGVFHVSTYLIRFVEMDPLWAAWAPTMLFGCVAAVMLDSVKT